MQIHFGMHSDPVFDHTRQVWFLAYWAAIAVPKNSWNRRVAFEMISILKSPFYMASEIRLGFVIILAPFFPAFFLGE